MNELRPVDRYSHGDQARRRESGGEDLLDIRSLWLVLRRRLGLMLAVAAIVFAAVALITLQMTPKFTASAQVMLDPREREVVDLDSVLSGLPPDSTVVDTEVEILRSRALAKRVAESLSLYSDAEFNPALFEPRGVAAWTRAAGSAMSGLVSALSPARNAGTPTESERLEEQREETIDELLEALSVRRQGLTYVIEISATSRDPRKAAEIANEFADKYLVEQLEAKFEATRTANEWLEQRLGDLREEVSARERAIEVYRAEAGLLESEGLTLNEQQISDLNAQIVLQRADLAEKRARLRAVENLISSGGSGQDISEALSSDVIRELRSQQAEVIRRQAELSSRYGERHPEMLKVRRELADVEREIEREANRIVTSLRNEVEVARQRVASLEASIARQRDEMAENNSALVQLRELEREAEASRTLYESFLSRFRQTSEQQSLQQTDARVISEASPPARPSSPDLMLNLALGLALAGVAAAGAAYAAESFDQGIATREALERELGVSALALIPQVPSRYGKADKAADYVLDRPLSSYAESLRALRTALLYSRRRQGDQVIALTSALPGEGKTATTLALGRVSAKLGAKTLVIDADNRRRMLTKLMGQDPEVGLLEVLDGACPVEQALVREDASGLHVLPLTEGRETASDVFGRPGMKDLLQLLRDRYETIILDTAPAMAVAETRILSTAVDSMVLLVRWRKTPRAVARAALDALAQVDAPVAGAALTQVNLDAEGRYGYGSGPGGSYYKYYRKYYQD